MKNYVQCLHMHIHAYAYILLLNFMTPTSGSFVRPHCLDFGTELFDEIIAKYAADFEETHQDERQVQNGCGIRWEMVKMDKIHRKQREIFQLRCIVLSSSSVSHLEINKLGEQRFVQCRELDLSESLVGHWDHIHEILLAFPNLHTFRLSTNRIESLEQSGSCFTEIGSQITHLSMSGCRLSEYTANHLTAVFPNLEELYLADNRLVNYTPVSDCQNLKLLDLQLNTIEDIQQISQLFKLPKLAYLNLSSCGLKKLYFGDGFTGFRALKILILQDNPIGEWTVVDELARLPALEKLILKGVPLPGSRGVDSREMIIAKLPQLTDLDRCDVSPVARRSAELLFLSRFNSLPIDEEQRKTVQRLVALYGDDNVHKNGSSTPAGQPSPSQMTIQFRRVRLIHKERCVQRSLSLALPIHKIMGLGSRLFGFDPDQLKGIELRRANPAFRAELLPRTRDNLLRQYDIDDGDSLAFV